jgi:hypothetical protein
MDAYLACAGKKPVPKIKPAVPVKPCIGDLNVHVVSAREGADLKDVKVDVTGPERLYGTTDAYGNGLFSGIKCGQYTVLASKKGYTDATEKTDVKAYTTNHVEIKLKKVDVFSVSIDLPETGDSDLLTPLVFPNGGWGDSTVRFDIEIESENPSFQATRTEFQVLKNGTLIYEEKHESKFVKVGEHTWYWHGFDSNSVLDTERLMGKGLSVKVLVTKDTVTQEAEEKLDNEPEEVDWVDLTVDLTSSKVNIAVYVDCQNEGGMASSMFSKLKQLVLDGISHYWSRNITVGGQIYQVTTKAIQRTDKSEDLDLYLETGNEYVRSHNSGIIDGSIFYNKGRFPITHDADQNFKRVAAHEFGHAILEAFGGKSLSWGHKGTVGANPLKIWNFQDPLPSAPHYTSTGEIDLMKYYNGNAPPDYYVRSIAAEEDVKRLIWLARVDFDEE